MITKWYLTRFLFSKKDLKHFNGHKDYENWQIYQKFWSNYIYLFFTKNDQLINKYNKIWDKVSNSISEGFDIEPVTNEKYLKTKTKSYEVK